LRLFSFIICSCSLFLLLLHCKVTTLIPNFKITFPCRLFVFSKSLNFQSFAHSLYSAILFIVFFSCIYLTSWYWRALQLFLSILCTLILLLLSYAPPFLYVSKHLSVLSGALCLFRCNLIWLVFARFSLIKNGLFSCVFQHFIYYRVDDTIDFSRRAKGANFPCLVKQFVSSCFSPVHLFS
jgi:hypothetical protein